MTLMEKNLDHIVDKQMREEYTWAWKNEVTQAKKRVNKVKYVEFTISTLWSI